MTDTILQTKLHIPITRPSLVSRQRLHTRFDKGLGGKMTLVSAQAGFGKSTVVVDWLASSTAVHRHHICWLSLDNYDNDPNRFWQYILAALQTAVPDIGVSLQPLLSSSPLPLAPIILTGLINEIAELPQPLILVIDDYHIISDTSIHEGVQYLLDYMPSQLHLVLITRADPPLSLSRLRASGWLNEIRAADLHFTTEETAVFLRDVMGLNLPDEDITAIQSRTEGWIVGLQLMAVSLQGRLDPANFIQDFAGSHHYILEYLAEQVLLRQPHKVQTFLLQTSILARLSAPLCDAVTGGNESQAILISLYNDNLFVIPLDNELHWVRYHSLFANLLANQLRQNFSADDIKNLHRRASLWCAQEGMWETAVTHSIEAGDWQRAAEFVARTYPLLNAQGRIATWQKWLSQIPQPIIEERPALAIRQGWSAFLNGQVQTAANILNSAREKLLALPPTAEDLALRGELATYLATIEFFGEEPQRIIAAAEEALLYLPPEDLTARARATSALGMGVSLAGDTGKAMRLYQDTVDMARSAGHLFFLAHALELVADGQIHTAQLKAAAITCQEIIDLGSKDRAAPLPFAGNGHMKLASIYVEWHELAKAQEHIEAGMHLNRQGGIGYNFVNDHCTIARLRHALGDQHGALEALHQAQAVARHIQSRTLTVQLTAYAVQHWLMAGDTATAVSWVERQPLTGEPLPAADLPIIAQEVHLISLARVRLAQARADDVLAIREQIVEPADAAGRLARVIEIDLLAALAYQMKRETAVALEFLRNVLTLTRPQGYVRLFVEAGEPMQRLLRQLPAADQSEYVQQILHAFPDPLRLAATALIEPLSPRELEVLHLIGSGLSNKQIAATLSVSLNTVKKHTHHIYSKLEVNGRTQAIVRARELDIL